MIAKISFKNVSQFKYLGTEVTDQNLIQKKIKRRLNSGKACYHSVQNLLSSRLLSRNLKIRIYKTIILPVILYGCEEEHRLRVFEDRVLRRIFGPKRDEVAGGWRKLYKGKFRDLYSSPSIIKIISLKRMRWERHVARMGEKMKAYRLLVGKPEGKRPLGRTKRRCVDNIKMDLGEIGWCGTGSIGMVQDMDQCRTLV
jgi:hypothetical protein